MGLIQSVLGTPQSVHRATPLGLQLQHHRAAGDAAAASELGGLGGGAIENVVVMEEMGRAIVLEPYLSTVVIGGGALKHVGGAIADAVIPGIIAGTTRIAFAAYEPQGRFYLNDLTTTLKGGLLNG